MPTNNVLTAHARATIMDACQSISRSADALKDCHTVDGDWGDDLDAKALYDADLLLLEHLTNLLATKQPAPRDAIARSKRILGLVDSYHENPTQHTRTALRVALMDEFQPDPIASTSVIAAALAVIEADRAQTLTNDHIDALDNAIKIQRASLARAGGSKC